MTKLIRYLGLSIESILANKLRASLTMLGIIIGVAALLSTMGLGAGASANITSSIQSEGTNLLEISSSGSTKSLTINDAEILANRTLYPDFSAVLPTVNSNMTVVVNDNSSNSQIQGVQPAYATVKNLTLANGRFFTEEEESAQKAVAVLGSTLAQDLYGNDDPLGKDIRIGSDIFTVIGVLEESGGNSFFSNDNAVFVPFTFSINMVSENKRYIVPMSL